ncbi:MAG: DASS family sodium-coupled anion symporter [Oligoflexales bacterium]
MVRLLKICLGPLLSFLVFFAPFIHLNDEMSVVACVGVLMSTWWVLEAIPLPVTALVPIVAFPLSGVCSTTQMANCYSHPVLALFLGGCLMALGLERWGLHRRLALLCLLSLRGGTKRLIFSFLTVTAFLSLWISNTATTMMMIPVVISILDFQIETKRDSSLGVSLLLAVAYGATIGGMGTLMGTPPNSLLAGFLLQRYGVDLSFFDWFFVGAVFVAGLLPMAWLLLILVVSPPDLTEQEIEAKQLALQKAWRLLPSFTVEEFLLASLYICTIAFWIFRPWLSVWIFGDERLTDSGIAIFSGILMFILPARNGGSLLEWEQTKELPWGVFLLFGGGLALSKAVEQSGLALVLLESFGGVGQEHSFGVFAVVTALVLFLTELTSNIATTAAFLPILSEFSGVGALPLGLLVGVTLAASCAFMLPIATAPNALVFATGRLKISQMLRIGFLLNIVAWCWLLCLGRWVWPLLLPVVSKVPLGI